MRERWQRPCGRVDAATQAARADAATQAQSERDGERQRGRHNKKDGPSWPGSYPSYQDWTRPAVRSVKDRIRASAGPVQLKDCLCNWIRKNWKNRPVFCRTGEPAGFFGTARLFNCLLCCYTRGHACADARAAWDGALLLWCMLPPVGPHGSFEIERLLGQYGWCSC